MARRNLAAAAGLLGVLWLSACGSGGGSGEIDKSPNQIIKDMAAAIKSVHSFHMHGTVVSGSNPTALDLKIVGPQTLTGSVIQKGAVAHLVLVNGTFYIQGKQFFAVFANPQAAALVGDNWVKLPSSVSSSVQSSFGSFANTSTFSSCFPGLKNPSSISKSAMTLNGVSVVELSSGGYAFDVQAGRPAYPVRFKSTGGASPFLPSTNPACSNINSSTGSGTILFDNWGTTTTVTPPPSALDFSSLGG